MQLKKSLQKNKKPLSCLLLALIMFFTVNFSPISLLANMFSSSAYKSNVVQNYYSNPTTGSETKISAGKFPSELTEFFKESGNNFNIETYYNKRYLDIFAGHIHDYLAETANTNATFKTAYESFLGDKSYETLHEYYNAYSSSLNANFGCTDFYSYVEYFVSHETTGKYNSESYTVPALFTQEPIKSHFYSALANYLLSVNTYTAGDDGFTISDKPEDFKEKSKAYKAVKKFIDDKIVETVAIYSYDGYTQNNNMAAIIADKAPVVKHHYYQDSKFETPNAPYVKYEQTAKEISGTNVYGTAIYYLTTDKTYVENHANFQASNVKNYATAIDYSVIEANLLQYRQIKSGETGYIDATHPTYYKYVNNSNVGSVPFETLNPYQVYVLDNDVTESEKATYDSLYYKVITSSDLTADSSLPVPYYYNLPFSTSAGGDKYFKLLQNYSGTTWTAYCNLFAPDGTSKLYLKIKTDDSYVVYIDPDDGKTLSQFKTDNPRYVYTTAEIDKSAPDYESDAYFKVTSSYSSYINVKGDYTLYFKKIKVEYETLDTSASTYTGEYVTTGTPNIALEQTTVPQDAYETVTPTSKDKKVYALVDNSATEIQIGSTTYNTVTQVDLNKETNRNFYVEAPISEYNKVYGHNEITNKLYYKHIGLASSQIYILDDADGAENNEVYKNLYYKVITTEDYKAEYAKFVPVTESDSNYNKNFKLYYKYNIPTESDKVFVQNTIKGGNAIYIIDDSLIPSDRTTYAANFFTVMTTAEYNASKAFFVQIDKDDPNYSPTYTKLYYKYTTLSGQDKKTVYLYSSSKSDKYTTFYNTDADYVASDYELIKSNDPNYVEGLNLYYKKIRTEAYTKTPQKTYYYFTTSSAVTLNANSYYAVSFYVNTTGEYSAGVPVEASLYIKDTKNILSDISFEKISTDGKWVKYIAFIATDALSASAVQIQMYLGDKNSISGSATGVDTVTGSVLFDDLKITKINETDFAKKAFDNTPVTTTEEHKKDDAVTSTIDVIIANTDSDFNTANPSNRYDYRTSSTIATTMGTWDSMFNFDDNNLKTEIENLTAVTKDTDGYTEYTKLWQYYISKTISGQGSNDELTDFQKAYINNNLNAEIVLESDINKTLTNLPEKDEEDDEDKKEDDKKEDETTEDNGKDVIDSTFNENNKVLKLNNKNGVLSLGLVSNGFEIKQYEYYKLTVWVFSPDYESSATLELGYTHKTAQSQERGVWTSTTATIDACYAAQASTVTNEYGWIPVSFYIEGGALDDYYCHLVLSADKNSTVYFDNITIQNISSTAYDTANSDSDKVTTFNLSLIPSDSVITNGITNGYFNNITLKENFLNPEVTEPKAVKSWTVDANSSSAVVAGIVPTSKNYVVTNSSNNFYTKYNNGIVPYADGFDENTSYNNVYAIYSPSTIKNPINENDATSYTALNSHKIYSTSTSLTASTVYEISFDFFKGYEFDGYLIANLYYGSVDASKIVAQIKIHSDDIAGSAWSTYTFYVANGLASSSVYLEFGVQSATGTVFFKNARAIKTTKTLDAIRADLIDSSENLSNATDDVFNKNSLKNVRFVDFSAGASTIHGTQINESTGLYDTKEYTNSLSNTSKYTVGKSGVAVASYYDDTNITKTYSVTIDKVTYYIGSVKNENDETVYKLYKYEDCLADDEVTEIGGKAVTVESFKKVIVGENASTTEYSSTETEKVNYIYHFNNDYMVGNTYIPSNVLKNAQSENVMILSNGLSTDYTLLDPVYTNSLTTSAFYVLKIYVKTSNFESNEFGLNINVSALSNAWYNINTTDATNKDEYGFVCYQILIKTNTSSVSKVSATFSLGSESKTGTGYAIISGVTLEKFASEDLFNHYESTLDENDATIKRYFGTEKSETKESTTEEDDKMNWATFFYIFSSLLLVVTMAIALVAVILKKHPIKTTKKVQNDHERSLDIIDIVPKTTTKKSKAKTKSKATDENADATVETSETTDEPEAETKEEKSSETDGIL